MKVRILTVTHRTPPWISAAYQEYLKRLQSHCTVELIEIAAEKRTNRANIAQIIQREGDKILAAINSRSGSQSLTVALDLNGHHWSTETFATKLGQWQDAGRQIDFIIGGTDGLSAACLQKADEKWSLSNLTFPHAIVRVLVVEQLYRGFCILKQHPYHR